MKTYILISLLFITYNINCQNIKTINIYKTGNKLSYPIIKLNSNEFLTLTFDDLSEDIKYYSYKIIKYNKNWGPTSLGEYEYINGFNYGDIENYNFSRNTNINYVNYKFEFPNEDLKFLISGNYKILILLDNKEIFSRKFFVYSDIVIINSEIKRSIKNNNYQEVKVELDLKNFNENIELEYLNLNISQNYRIDRTINNVKFTNYFNNKVLYSQTNNVFYCGEEFLYVNTKDYRTITKGVKTIIYNNPYYDFILFPYKHSFSTSYKNREDINGKFKIDVINYNNSTLEANYVNVLFSIKSQNFNSDIKYFVVGNFNNYELNKQSELAYSFENKQFENKFCLSKVFITINLLLIIRNQQRTESSNRE